MRFLLNELKLSTPAPTRLHSSALAPALRSVPVSISQGSIHDPAQFVIMADHVLPLTSCSGSAVALLFHYTSTGFTPPWCWLLLPTRVPPITAVSQEAAAGTSELTALLSLIVSLSRLCGTNSSAHSVEAGDLRLSHFWAGSLRWMCSASRGLPLLIW